MDQKLQSVLKILMEIQLQLLPSLSEPSISSLSDLLFHCFSFSSQEEATLNSQKRGQATSNFPSSFFDFHAQVSNFLFL